MSIISTIHLWGFMAPEGRRSRSATGSHWAGVRPDRKTPSALPLEPEKKLIGWLMQPCKGGIMGQKAVFVIPCV